MIGPRTPFARDTALFDYSYDSGEDWEEEDDDAEDLESLSGSPKKRRGSLTPSASGGRGDEGSMWDTDEEDGDFGEDEEEEDGSEGSDEESWMVEEDEGNEESSRAVSPVLDEPPDSAFAAPKGRAAEKEKEREKIKSKPKPIKIQRQKGWGKKKKKIDAKGLVPVKKGPYFERELGVCEWEGFEGYRIQLLNGTSRSSADVEGHLPLLPTCVL